MHRQIRIGYKHSLDTIKKLSITRSNYKKGKPVKLTDLIKNKSLKFDSLAYLRKEINVSDRTINRWIIDGKAHKTKKILIIPFN